MHSGENLARNAPAPAVTDLAKANGFKPMEYDSLRAGWALQRVCTQ